MVRNEAAANSIRVELEERYLPAARKLHLLINSSKTRVRRDYYTKKLNKINAQAQALLYHLSTMVDLDDK